MLAEADDVGPGGGQDVLDVGSGGPAMSTTTQSDCLSPVSAVLVNVAQIDSTVSRATDLGGPAHQREWLVSRPGVLAVRRYVLTESEFAIAGLL
ncbi:hypothetical protein GCM10023322_32120 [Rugosimonospora acidiphila]|uniref:Uncharacterized protein n=1 Tax=Rugosimonospora acidiphila TaxID=556531 RepID=A0ABP9RSZ2_9ACTN